MSGRDFIQVEATLLRNAIRESVEGFGGPGETVALDVVTGIRAATGNGRYCDTGMRPYPLISDLDAESLPQPTWGLDRVYPDRGLVVVFGPRGEGKTFLVLGWAFAHATGRGWEGRAAAEGPVVYVLAEGRGGLGARVRAQKEYLGHEGIAGVHFLTTAVPMLDDTEAQRLIETIRTLGVPPAAIVWDTLSRTLVGGDENSSKDMAEYVAAVDRVKEAVGGTAIVVHHTGHGSTERERGSSVLGGAADTIVALRRRDGALEVSCEKQKDAPPFSPIPVQLHPVAESCVMKIHTEPWSNAGYLTQVEREALHTLHEGFLADGASASAWLAASEMATSSFYKARTSVVRRRLVEQKGNGRGARYLLTEEGARLLQLHTSTVAP